MQAATVAGDPWHRRPQTAASAACPCSCRAALSEEGEEEWVPVGGGLVVALLEVVTEVVLLTVVVAVVEVVVVVVPVVAVAAVVVVIVVVVAKVVEAAVEVEVVVVEEAVVVVEAVVGLEGSLLAGRASTASFLRVRTGTGGGRMMDGVA